MAQPTHTGTVQSNGRYGGGAGGPETRHHNPAADVARFQDAKEGSTVKTPQHGEMPQRLPQAQANTLKGGRGVIAGARLHHDRGGF